METSRYKLKLHIAEHFQEANYLWRRNKGDSQNMTKSYRNVTLADVRAMTRARCEIKNGDLVVKMINDMICAGASKLQVLSDFDYTITKQCLEDGSSPPTSFKMFNKCKSVPPTFLEEDGKLREVYRPLEIDPNISTEEKAEKMQEWWEKSADIFK
ncbi:unnamed protein product [Hermetia illucens]|uniref:5'-nucleotidase n=1 Tax=Hermetia illucens TaxID=343691 RepID=A0A7R8UX13_HERIL|nr:unnamed protein product [Hermetia illucens]